MFRAKINIFSIVVRALLFALLAGLILGYIFGYRYILVNGWSSEPYIPYQSIILTAKTELKSLKVGDFITYTSKQESFFSMQSNVTHQIIAIKYDGYFVPGEKITLVADDKTYEIEYGNDIKLDDEGNPVYSPIQNPSATCNIITMQRQNGKANISATKEFKNFNQVLLPVQERVHSKGRKRF